MNRPYTAESILEALFTSYSQLYNRFGVQPNAFLLSRELVTVLRNDYSGKLEVTYTSNSREMKINGLNVIVVEGLCVAKAAILEEEL